MKPSADESKTQAIPSPAASEDRPKEDAASPKKEKKTKNSDRPSSSPLLWFIGAFFGGLVLFSVLWDLCGAMCLFHLYSVFQFFLI